MSKRFVQFFFTIILFRSLAGSKYADGKPFCFFHGSPDTPESEWKWEECDIAECEVNCTRPGFETDDNEGLPSCEEYLEPNPMLQARTNKLICRY